MHRLLVQAENKAERMREEWRRSEMVGGRGLMTQDEDDEDQG
jgi:hypothetical protein